MSATPVVMRAHGRHSIPPTVKSYGRFPIPTPRPYSPVAVANGVVYVPSTAGQASDKNMIALNAATGQTLWSFASETTTIGGAAIVNGAVYWGTGYSHLPTKGFTGGADSFYAFTINGK